MTAMGRRTQISIERELARLNSNKDAQFRPKTYTLEYCEELLRRNEAGVSVLYLLSQGGKKKRRRSARVAGAAELPLSLKKEALV